MRMKVYQFLVNKHSGISARYHKAHDKSGKIGKIMSYLYLLWLNFAYYILFCHFLDHPKEERNDKQKLLIDKTESRGRIVGGKSIDETLELLSKYETISFDIFDTLIFRPFDNPTALFYLLGEKLGFMDFKRIRVEAESLCRWEKFNALGTYEVTLEEIWNKLEEQTGLSTQKGMKLEMDLERKYCYANPFMLKVFLGLVERKKNVIITSDMYLPEEFLREMLEEKGFVGASKLYVSNVYLKNKGSGTLFDYVISDLKLTPGSMIHIGDNEKSDIEMAEKHGFATCYYQNVNKYSEKYRAFDMSPIIGSAYRGLVNNHLYAGLTEYSFDYEYGFIYGGLFVVGYCRFVHEYCKHYGADKVLFLSRDGDILSQVYQKMYPDDKQEYVYWSRKAATKLMAVADRYDFLRRFVDHKVNRSLTMEKIFASMEIEALWSIIEESDKEDRGFDRDTLLTDGNVNLIKSFLLKHWEDVLACYNEEHAAACAYYKKVLAGCNHVLAVDIGWAGSGAIALNHLVQKVWNIPCNITGIIAGTNTIHNFEPYASETFLQNGQLVAYMYSMSHNRDLMKKHDPNKNYNVYWELLLSSPTKQFFGFGWKRDKSGEALNEVELRFGEYDKNIDGMKEIQQGILDFAEIYLQHFGQDEMLLHISGRDAYAPMLVAANYDEKYLKAVEKRYALDINVS